MDFNEYVALHKEKIYSKICEYVPIKEPESHYKIMRDYIDRKGKYARPGLLMLSAQLFGADEEEALLPAAAQQLSEDWILMQDDWEDDAQLRRGKPTAHRIYGDVHTINASNVGNIAMW
ncbi:MAG: polyprenyl synthetase family protein, partial [Candidatus Micrarchaeia archaeon]